MLSSSSSSSTISPFIPTVLLLISLPILFILAPRFLPPRNLPIYLPDELDDLSLLRRASEESYINRHHETASPSLSRPSSKFRLGHTNPKPKIAFMFLTNSDIHFSPLWEMFFKSNHDLFNVYIHADPSIKINQPGGVFSSDRFIPSKKTSRGTSSLVAAARRLLATALLDDPDNTFFSLVSQHCIPIHSFKFVYDNVFDTKSHQIAELKKVNYKSFIEIISKTDYLLDRYNARGKNVMVPEVPFEKFKFGSQFFTVTRRHALLIVGDRRLWRKFKLTCINTESCYPEEHYFPTLLSMEDPKGCAQYTLTNVNWTDSVDAHPHTYYPTEVSPELIYELRKSNFTLPYMFARKFSPDCLQKLLDMADNVLFRD